MWSVDNGICFTLRISIPTAPNLEVLPMASPLGVPVKLLHEALGHVITVELKTGQLYRGKLAEGNPRVSLLA